MLHTMLGIPKNEGDSRILKKVQELVQHLSEQHRHYVPRQNISIEENLINYKEEKRKEQTKGKKKERRNCGLYKSEKISANILCLRQMRCGLMWCIGLLAKVPYQKEFMDYCCICFSYFYL